MRDLMHYCWDVIASDMNIDHYCSISHDERTIELFSRFYDYMDSIRASIDVIISHNTQGGDLVDSLQKYIMKKVREIMEACPKADSCPVPNDIIVHHYCNTVTMILENCFLKKTKMSKEAALRCLDFLIGSIERNK